MDSSRREFLARSTSLATAASAGRVMGAQATVSGSA
jgi:hypothetical protein